MDQIEVNGAVLPLRRAGRGPTVLLVHGSANDLRAWTEVLDALAHDVHVVAYSRRYHPPGPPIPEGADYAFEEHYADLAALTQALAPEGAHLVGHSYGALLALVLAARRPELVRSLVLMEPPA